MEPIRSDAADSKVIEAAIHELAQKSIISGSPDSAPVLSLLRRLLSPVVCRRLGIYEWPENFLLSVVIPVFNEATTVATLIEKVREVGVP